MKTRLKGFSLIEIVIGLAIFGILMASSLPSMSDFLTKNQVASQLNLLVGLNNFARNYAISNKVVLTFCPSSDAATCSNYWEDGQILFIDKNNNQIKDNDEQILRTLAKLPDNHRLTWRAFQNKKYLQYKPTGYTKYQNGTFRYCVEGGILKFNRALIMSLSGRVRLSQDFDGDGIHEDRDGKPVKCD